MVAIQGGPFLMGSRGSDPNREAFEVLHRKRIGRRFAVSATAVTRAQYRVFQEANQDDVMDVVNHPEISALARREDAPITGVMWYEAAAYCNWLSEREGIAEDQWCYDRNAEGNFGPGMRPKSNYLALLGYRLPSEAECKYSCQAGAITRRYYGHSDDLLSEYAWYNENSGNRVSSGGLKKPNDFGLFDVLGNVWTWCHNRSSQYGETEADGRDVAPVNNGELRVVHGAAFYYWARHLRSAKRNKYSPNDRVTNVGFRVARTYPLPPLPLAPSLPPKAAREHPEEPR